VIVPPEAFDLWLDTGNVDAKTAAALIAPAPEGAVEVYPVSPAVNRTANDSPDLIVPYRAPAVTASRACADRACATEPAPTEPAPDAQKAPRRRRGGTRDGGQGSLF
jgi:hypothetical protein